MQLCRGHVTGGNAVDGGGSDGAAAAATTSTLDIATAGSASAAISLANDSERMQSWKCFQDRQDGHSRQY